MRAVHRRRSYSFRRFEYFEHTRIAFPRTTVCRRRCLARSTLPSGRPPIAPRLRLASSATLWTGPRLTGRMPCRDSAGTGDNDVGALEVRFLRGGASPFEVHGFITAHGTEVNEQAQKNERHHPRKHPLASHRLSVT